jgi:hypothetical protein
VARHPSLWHTVDLSYGWIKTKMSTLQWLSSNRLKATKNLNLSSWSKLTHDGVKVIGLFAQHFILLGFVFFQLVVDNCRHLQSLNLSFCKLIKSNTVLLLADSCPQMKAIDLTSTSVSFCENAENG